MYRNPYIQNPYIQMGYNLGTMLGMGIAQRDADRRQREIDEKLRAEQTSNGIGSMIGGMIPLKTLEQPLQPAQQPIDYTKIGSQTNGNSASVPSLNQANSNNPYQFTTPNAVSMLQKAPTIDDVRKQGNINANFTQGEAKYTQGTPSDLTDPNYKNDLWTRLRQAGYGSDDIQSYADRTKLDDRIKEAKTNKLNVGYYTSLANGDMLGASYFLSQLANMNPQITASNMANNPSYKDLFNIQVNRENAQTANKWKQQAQYENFKFKDYQQAQKFQYDFDLALQKGNIDKALAVVKSQLKTDEHRRQLETEFQAVASAYGKEKAMQMLANKVAGVTGGGKGGIYTDPTQQLERLYKMKKLAEESGSDSSLFDSQIQSVERDVSDVYNNNVLQPASSIGTSEKAYSQATKVLELAQQGRFNKGGQQITKEGIYHIINQLCGAYGPQIINEWKNNPTVQSQLSMFE